MLSGGVGLKASLGEYFSQRRVARRITSADFISDTLAGLRRFPGQLLVVLSGRDLVAKEFMDTLVRRGNMPLLSGSNQIRKDIPDADHTFSQSASREAMEAAMLAWLKTVF